MQAALHQQGDPAYDRQFDGPRRSGRAVRDGFDGDAVQRNLCSFRSRANLRLWSDQQWLEQALVPNLDGGKDRLR